MSFIKRMLASVGIGSAKVDTVLEKSAYYPGETVRGKVYIQGGDIKQQVDRIYLHLMTEYIRKRGDDKVRERGMIASFPISEPLVLAPNEKKEILFSFELPLETPMTIYRTKVWVHTGLEIKSSIDPSDHDDITILEHPNILKVRKAIASIGFYQTDVEQVYLPPNRYTKFPVAQEFEYKPTGNFAAVLDEIEIIYFIREEGLQMLVELDKRNRGLFGAALDALEMDEKIIQVTLTNDDLKQDIDSIGTMLKDIIRSHMQ